MARYDVSAHESYGIMSEDVENLCAAAKTMEKQLQMYFGAVIERDNGKQRLCLETMETTAVRIIDVSKQIREDADRAVISIGMPEQMTMFEEETGEVVAE